MAAISGSRRQAGVLLGLAALVLAVYWPVGSHPFTGYDDDVAVLNNAWVRAGWSAAGLRWAFSGDSALWTPLVWLSHMTDVQLFGLQAGMHHLTNLLLHLAGTLLLFGVLRAMTGSRWKSAFASALFAVHPLHVESVAWITERKDVLSGVFWMLALAGYVRYAHRPQVARYLALLVAFVLGLMAKPSGVTLPFVLLLLDYWPLDRFRVHDGAGTRAFAGRFLRLAAEKLPLLLVAGGASLATLLFARRVDVVSSLEAVPLWARLANAVHSYAWYALKAVWPASLGMYYPHPGAAVELWPVFAAAFFLGAATWLAVRAAARRPPIAVGWLWFLVTLLPAIGLVQIGSVARADRYAYLPLIGLYLVAGWGVPAFLAGRRHLNALLPWCAGGVVLSLAVAGCVQVRYWKDDETLFRRALAVTRGNWMIHGNLGASLMEQGDLEGAIAQFREALRHNPSYELARLNLGQALSLTGRDEEAEQQFRELIGVRPDDGRAHFCLGRHLAALGRWDEAIRSLETAVRVAPGFTPAYEDLGGALLAAGRSGEALLVLQEALRRDPRNPAIHEKLALALQTEGRMEEAQRHRREAGRLGGEGE